MSFSTISQSELNKAIDKHKSGSGIRNVARFLNLTTTTLLDFDKANRFKHTWDIN